jgi:endonuclease/exonuclease/phosphatase (EEP) superfamily protein YafD
MASLLLLSSCATHDVGPGVAVPVQLAAIAACQSALFGAVASAPPELDASNIRLLSWNVQKNKRTDWRRDFELLTSDRDLVLVQEASLREDSIDAIDSSRYWSFAPGYVTPGAISGVLTMSRSKPIAQCSFVNYEPLLRTPKATNITRYGLTATDETLVVVNIHAVNFSMGLGAFERQFEQVQRVLEAHEGPVIFSGDFNTWRTKRITIVANLAESLGLTPLEFAEDKRKKIFGNYLDHIYVRGLSAVDSSTGIVSSSDHNPMSVTLQL